MNVYLTGFMGSGKSGFGKQLATKLNRPFVDLDKEVEEAAGMTISDIFEMKGESEFRKMEFAQLTRWTHQAEAVIALGGGACCSGDAWKILKSNGLTIFIKVREEILFGRLREHKENRPLIANLSDEELRQYISEKLLERQPWYDRSDLIYEKESTSLSFLVNQIHSFLQQP